MECAHGKLDFNLQEAMSVCGKGYAPVFYTKMNCSSAMFLLKKFLLKDEFWCDQDHYVCIQGFKFNISFKNGFNKKLTCQISQMPKLHLPNLPPVMF